MQQISKVSGVQPCKVTGNWVHKALSIVVPFAKTYLCECGYFYLLHLKKCIGIISTPRTISRGFG